jgi:NAD(P)-dependent dehydrogenase (short-subunit alcohol dehydrogenase family)
MTIGLKLFDLTGKTAIVTGGSKGLGFSMAQGLASAGANVVLVSRNAEEAQQKAQAIADQFSVQAMGLSADVASEEQVASMVEEVVAMFGGVDILINSAGINIRRPINELTLDEFNQVMTINVTGTWLCCRAVVPVMKQRGWGRIINLASALGVVGLAGRTPYASSKGAITQLTRTLALETAADNITVNAICPGPFLTDMNESIAQTDDGQKFVVGATALKRWARLEEIQGAAIYLASPASSYTTGSMLMVDGGWTAQ